MTPVDSDSKKPGTDNSAPPTRGEKAFANFDFAITVVKVSVVVLGLMIVIIAISGVDLARADEHEVFRYRMYAAAIVIVGYLLIYYLRGRRRALRATDAEVRSKAITAQNEFELSIGTDTDQRAAPASAEDKARPKRGYGAELLALAFVAAGGAAFWQDHMNYEIPNPVAVPAKFVSAVCVDRTSRRIGGSVAPHMSIGYEFPSQSTSVRVQQTKCLLENCEPEKAPPQYMDTENKRVFYASLQACNSALPAVLAANSPTTVWTGDKDLNASVRARFTPERDTPPYFLLWFPSLVAALVLLVLAFFRSRRTRTN